MAWAVDKGLLNGTETGLEPQSNATRVQVAAVLERFSKNILTDMQVHEGDLGGGVRYSLNGQTGVMNVYWTGEGSGITNRYHYRFPSEWDGKETPFEIEGLTEKIREIRIQEGVKGLTCHAFANCNQVEKMSIPASLTDVRIILKDGEYDYGPTSYATDWNFVSSNKLKEFTVADGNPSYCSVDGVLFNKEQTELVQYPGNSERETYAVPDGVTEIDPAAFNNVSNLKHLIIPDSVTDFQRLYGCLELEDIQMPQHLESDILTIYDCQYLKELTVPEGVKKLHICRLGIVSLSLPSTVTRSYTRIITGPTPNLQNITVSEENSTFSSVDGILFSKDGKSLVHYPQGRTGDYTVPDGVTKIEYVAFTYGSLKSCVIPEGVEKIENTTFDKCTNLESLTLPASLTWPIEGNHLFESSQAVKKDIYFAGTKAQWKKLLFYNLPEGVSVHFNCK